MGKAFIETPPRSVFVSWAVMGVTLEQLILIVNTLCSSERLGCDLSSYFSPVELSSVGIYFPLWLG